MEYKGRFKHYKGGDYTAIQLARHTETEEELVIYHPTDNPESLWARPRTMFEETVTIDGTTKPRFERVD